MFWATFVLKHMAWGQGYSWFEANRKECWFLNICFYLSQLIRGYRSSLLAFEPLGMNFSYWLYVLLWWYRHFNGKRHACMMWFMMWLSTWTLLLCLAELCCEIDFSHWLGWHGKPGMLSFLCLSLNLLHPPMLVSCSLSSDGKDFSVVLHLMSLSCGRVK